MNREPVKNTKLDILVLTIYSIVFTLFMAAVTIGMLYISGIDPRNDFWGQGLASIGVLAIPIFGWPAGIYHIWNGY